MTPKPQITVLDTGGQYCHLIARKVRECGVYADVKPSETPAAELADRKGLIISGGPSSVYDEGSPSVDPQIFSTGQAVLGICYGQQLMAHLLGAPVQRGRKGEYGLAMLDLDDTALELFRGTAARQQIWMSHRDQVIEPPAGFRVVARTGTCAVAAIAAPSRKLYGLQFHPEVVHTHHGKTILNNFLFDVCNCTRDWDPKHRVPLIENEIRQAVGDRNVFFFVSGGVDSTVAFTLCLRALGPQRVRGVYVDTGLMREGETEFVRAKFAQLGGEVSIEEAAPQFLAPLAGVCEPEKKRAIIGEEFVRVQERIIESLHLLEGNWILGQGTIYPDTIESGGTAKAAVIKTHHNRVPGIQALIASGRIVEPLASFYKDEVREIGRELAVPDELLHRHPFPGPALAIRCLCSDESAPVRRVEEGHIVPVHSVGVQGDFRTYAPVLAIDTLATDDATEIINRREGINRVVAFVAGHAALGEMSVLPQTLSPERLKRLRASDAIVRRLCEESRFEAKVWQFPVILIPVGALGKPDSIVLRPIDSVDGMTAQAVVMPESLLQQMTAELLAIEGLCAVFYDLTHKPPGTIEWE